MKDPSKFRFRKIERNKWDDANKGRQITIGRDKVSNRSWWKAKERDEKRSLRK